MQRNLRCAILAGSLIGAVLSTLAWTQNSPSPSMDEQLRAQYKPVRLGNATGDLTVLAAGTVLDIQKAGIVAFPPQNVAICPAKFENGNLKSPGAFCVGMVSTKDKVHYLPIGEKVYPLKLEVNAAKEKIAFEVLECDSCNGATDPSFYKAEVLFQFAKGYLEKAGVPEVEDVIGQVFAIDQSGAPQSQNSQAAQDQSNNQSDAGPQAPPQTIQLGETIDEVVAALGQPDKIVNLGAKQIYVYRDLKVTFEDGKVKDVE